MDIEFLSFLCLVTFNFVLANNSDMLFFVILKKRNVKVYYTCIFMNFQSYKGSMKCVHSINLRKKIFFKAQFKRKIELKLDNNSTCVHKKSSVKYRQIQTKF